MKLWLLTQAEVRGFDTYDSCVVAAPSEDAARHTHPDIENIVWDAGKGAWVYNESGYMGEAGEEVWRHEWSRPEAVAVQFLGDAAPSVKAGVVCSSYNAG